jgi:ATP-dependent Zn protease
VKEVSINKGYVYFSSETETVTSRTGEKKVQIYQTGQMDDPELVNRLVYAQGQGEEGKITFTKVIPKENSPFMNILMYWILPGLLLYFGATYMMKNLARKGGMGGNFMSFGEKKEKIYAKDEIKTTFAEVAGQDEAKESLMEIVDFLHYPDKYASIGATLPKGALLVGPPGTGKTLIARATAGSSGAEIANIVNEGALRAVRMGRDKVTTADLEESIETVIAGAQRKNKVISDEEKRTIAYHEIGHALVAAKQPHSAPVHKITIILRTGIHDAGGQ